MATKTKTKPMLTADELELVRTAVLHLLLPASVPPEVLKAYRYGPVRAAVLLDKLEGLVDRAEVASMFEGGRP